MKKSFLRVSILLALLPTLSACNSGSHVILMNSLESMSGSVQKLENITGDRLSLMFETKQSFVLYFKQQNCGLCQQVEPYFTKLVNQNNFLIHSYSNSDVHHLELRNKYPDLFDVTPKTMFIKNGELVMTLSASKYNNEKAFLNTMNEFCLKSEMYSARTSKGLDYFKENFNDYFVFVTNFDNSKTHEIFADIVYPILSTASSPSLIVDSKTLGETVYQNFITEFDLDGEAKDWAFNVKNGTKKDAINYLDNIFELNEMLAKI